MTHTELWTKVGQAAEMCLYEDNNWIKYGDGLCIMAARVFNRGVYWYGFSGLIGAFGPAQLNSGGYWFGLGPEGTKRRATIAYLFAAMTQAEFEDMLGTTYKEHDIPITKEQ